MVRSADVAEDRQGGGGGGFAAPAFNIPFQVILMVMTIDYDYDQRWANSVLGTEYEYEYYSI